MKHTLFEVLVCYPSAADLARSIQVAPASVRAWFARGRIPQERWPALIESMQARGMSLSAEELLAMNAPRAKQGWVKGRTRPKLCPECERARQAVNAEAMP